MLTNLLSNAVKFTDHGTVGLTLRCSHAAGQLHVALRVTDTGIGIAPQDQTRLFERFVQADPTSTRRHGGVGLGLAISKQLVELMGGTITLQSQPGAGTTFTTKLTLPLEDSPAPTSSH